MKLACLSALTVPALRCDYRIEDRRGRCNEIGHLSRNCVPVQLSNSVLRRHQIAARRFCSAARGVLGQFCVMYHQQEFTLLC